MQRAFRITSALSSLALAALLSTGVIGVAVPDQAVAQTAPPATTGSLTKPKAAKKPKAEKTTDAEKQDPAEAQKLLVAGQAALAAGKPDVAVTNLNGALAGRGLGEQDLAKALYLRGAAYRKLAKPALAIADLNGALYIRKGLGEADRRDADEQRAAAYREAGLPDQKVTASLPAKPIAAPATTAAMPAPATTVAAAAAPVPQPTPGTASGNSSGGIGGFFGSLFGGSSSPAAAQPPAPAAAPAPTQPAVTSWSTKTQTPAAGAPAVAAPPVPVKAAAPSPPVFMQVANVRTRVEAESIATKVKQQNAGDLGDRPVAVAENVAGSFGTLYAVRVGPFADQDDSRALCTKFRAQGLDCLAVPLR